MKKLLAVLLSTTCASLAVLPALAQDVPPPIEPEVLTVKPTIDPGPNFFVMSQSWSGASTLQVFAADDFTYKGGMSAGSIAQSQISADGTAAYTVSVYLRRFMTGDAEMVLQVYDVASLTVTQEILLPPKLAMVGSYEHLFQLSADERFALVMNATPAASVTVVDLEAGEVAMEVPTPGCWNLYPATAGLKWTMLCGDGTAMTFVMSEDGTEIVSQSSAPLFDVDADALFSHAQRGQGDELLFVSYTGNVYRLSDAEETPELIEVFNFTDVVETPFAPGGYSLIAYNEANNVLFVTVHSNPYDGSHKDPGEEIWVVDLETNALVYRLQPEPGIASLIVTEDETPTLYAFNEHDYTVHAYTIDLTAPFGIIMTETAVLDAGGQVMMVRE